MFEEYGVKQSRHRIIIVGIREYSASKGIKFGVPAPTINSPMKYRTSYEAIMHPPIPEDAPNHEFTKHTKRVREMLSYIPPGENAWYPGIPEELRLNVKGARSEEHTSELQSRGHIVCRLLLEKQYTEC